MDTFNKIEKKIESYDRQDRAQANLWRTAEPLVKKLKQGRNYLTPDQFSDVVNYLYPYPEEDAIRGPAIARDECRLGQGITLVRVSWLTNDRLFSITDMAKHFNIPRRSLTRIVAMSNLPAQRVGNKMMYDIDMLRAVLEQEDRL